MSYYLISGDYENSSLIFMQRLSRALDFGVRLVQVRAKGLPAAAYKALCAPAIPLCHRYGAKVLLNGHADMIEELDADGVHFPSGSLVEFSSRPVEKNRIFSAACHDLAQLRQAEKLGADLVLLSPVLATPSSPEKTPLGWDRFGELVTQVGVPVYALGGMELAHLPEAQRRGAKGIAAIRALWQPSSQAVLEKKI